MSSSCGGAAFALSPVVCSGSLHLLWPSPSPCVVSGLVWGCLELDLKPTRHLSELQQHQTAGCFPCVVPWKLSLVGGATLTPDVCPSLLVGPHQSRVLLPSPLLGAGVTLEWYRLLFGLSAQGQVCGSALANGRLEGAGLQESTGAQWVVLVTFG